MSRILTIASLAAMLFATHAARAEHPVQTIAHEHSITSDNGLVRVSIIREDAARGREIPHSENAPQTRITQSFAARRGEEWIVVATAFTRPHPLPADTMPLYLTRQHRRGREIRTADECRLIVTEGLSEMRVEQATDDQAIIILSGRIGLNELRQTVRLRRGEPWVHIDVTATLAGNPPRLEYLLLPIEVQVPNPPDVTHLPAHKRGPDFVAGDRMFFSPVAMMQHEGTFAAIMPDLDVLNDAAVVARAARQHPDAHWLSVPVEPDTITMPVVLDLELKSGMTPHPLLAYGLMDTLIRQHVFWEHPSADGQMVRTLSDRNVRFAFDLFISADAPAHRGYQALPGYLWRRYAIQHLPDPRPQALPLDHYPRIVYPAYARYQGYEIAQGWLRHRDLPGRPEMNAWQQWEIDGVPVGGWRMGAPQWYHLVYYTPWFNNVFDAQGMYYWGRRLGDKDLIDKARRAVNLILSAPQTEGMFPSLYLLNERRWSGSLWRPPAEDYDPSRPERYFDGANGAYQTAATSNTAGFLLEYYRDCEPHPQILPFVQRYAEFLMANMEESGVVPAWFGDDLQPLPSMRFNADGGAHIWVLAELYKISPDPRYRQSAERMAEFLITEILPAQRWIDFECFYSCAVKPETFFDSHTGQGPRNTMSMIWAMRGLLSLYEVTQNERYLDAAEAVTDYASLFQAVWVPHFIITAYPFGGYSPQIGDAEWLDQRSNVMAGPMVRLGLALGRQDLIERGVALAKSGLALMNHPLHRENDIYRFSTFPVGIGPENIDHDGFPQVPLNSAPTWSTVGTMGALADVSRLIGGAYVDVQKSIAVGADGVRVHVAQPVSAVSRELHLEITNQLIRLPVPHEEPFEIKLHVTGLPDDGSYRLIVNEAQVYQATAAELEDFAMRIDP